MKKRIAILALIAISNLANAQLNENQNEFIKVNQNNLLNDEERFQENKILVFGNFNFYNKNSRHSNNFKRKGSVKPPITPEEDPLRPIEDFKPITPERDPLRPIEDFEPITPEKDPLRPIEDFEPITPERDPLRPLEDFEPITPEVPVIPIIIWEDGKNITGTSYTLTHDVITNTNDGLKTEGGEIINEATITVKDESNYGMRVEKGGNGINNGVINGINGIIAVDKGKIINNGLISLTEPNISKVGIQADISGILINKETGVIEIESNDGTWNDGFKVGEDSTGINKGQLTLNGDGTGKFGMGALDNGIITNEETGQIEINNNGGIWNYGMSVKDNGIGINKGSITLNGDGTGKFGMEALDNGTITNEETGQIEINNNGGFWNYGMSIKDNGIGINKGNITLNSDGTGYGMSARDSGTITNEKIGKIEINSNGGANYGMSVKDNGIGINKGSITLNGDGTGYGMSARDSGTITNEKNIVINSDNGVGMYADNTSTAINKGTININGYNSLGLEATKEATVTNDGTIKLTHTSNVIAIHASYGGTGINKSQINTEGIHTSGAMYAEKNGTIINESTGIINVTGLDLGMIATSNSTAINKGTIDLNFGSMYSGMEISSNSIGINEGVINLNKDDQIGMEIRSNSTGINKGTINLNGDSGIGIYVDSTSSYTNTGTINIISGTTGNQKIVTETGSKMINSGKIVSEGEFNTSNGQFIMSDGGTLEADKIKGDIYASGALAMGGYDDMYSTYKMLKTTNLEGDIISNSAMFDANFTENTDENGFYDVVLDRKDFNTIVRNGELGKILEDNYEENGDKFKEDYYDALKLVATEKGLNKAAKDSYGMFYYPTLAKQTFEIINDSNQVIVNNVIDNVKYREVDETIAVAGVNVTRLENDSYNDISGYDTDLYSVYLGAEKQLSKNTRIGGIITIGKSNTEFKENEGGPREDYYYQGNLYITYENDERLKFTSMVFGGITDTSLERTLAFGSLNETMTDDINNYYLGINNEVSKKYYFNRNYIKPKFEINFAYIMQDDISESGDQGLEIDGVNSISLETGIGLALGRDFYLENRSKINLEGSVTGYAELGDPYKDLNSIFNTLSTDKVKIDGYNNDDFYGEVLMGGSYETEDLLTIYTKVGYKIGNDSSGFIGNIGMNYLF